MGYYTSYSLKILDPATQEPVDEQVFSKVITELFAECDYAEYALDDEGNTNESAKWYDSDDDLREFSKQHPSLLFKLSGEGEENSDLWEKYFLDGKMQDCSATVVYPSYDASKLR